MTIENKDKSWNDLVNWFYSIGMKQSVDANSVEAIKSFVSDISNQLILANAGFDSLNGTLQETKKRVYELKEALETIYDPVNYLQKKAESEGCKINGLAAIKLSNNAIWLKDIAKKALGK